jgi:hypothetical protein
MKDIEQLKNYRTKYKRYYDIDFDKDFAIHHIDGNRNNNDINNLLLLPRGLHNKLHMCFKTLKFAFGNELTLNKIIFIKKSQLKEVKKFFDALEEVNKWAMWKIYNYDSNLKDIIFDNEGKNGR